MSNISNLKNKLNEAVRSKKLDKEIINELFLLFENEELFTLNYENQYYVETRILEDTDFNDEVIISLMKMILEDKDLKSNFLELINENLSNGESGVEVRIMEVLLNNLNREDFRVYFEDCLPLIFEIIWKVQKGGAETGFWGVPDGYIRAVGTSISPFVKDKIVEIIKSNDFLELLFLLDTGFINTLNENDAKFIFSNKDIDFLNYLLEQIGSYKKRDQEYECGYIFSEELELNIGEIMKESVINVLKSKNKAKIEALFRLELYHYLVGYDFNSLPKDVLTIFFLVAHEVYWEYHMGDFHELDKKFERIGIKDLESECLKIHIKKTIKEGNLEEIINLFYKWVIDILRESDFIELWQDKEIDLFNVFLKVNKNVEPDDDGYGFNFSPRLRESVPDFKEKIIKTIKRNLKREIEILIREGLFRYLENNEIDQIIVDSNLDFLYLLFDIYSNNYYKNDMAIGIEINNFFKKNKDVISRHTKKLIIKIMKGGNLQDIFNTWKCSMFYYINEQEFKELLTNQDFNLMEHLLRAVHFYVYEKDYDAGGLFSLFSDEFEKNVRQEIKKLLIDVIKKNDMETLVPLIGLGYIYFLELHELKALSEDPEISLISNLLTAFEEYQKELFYYNDSICLVEDDIMEIIRIIEQNENE